MERKEREFTVKWEVQDYANTPEDAVLKVAKTYFQDRIAHGTPDSACVFSIDGIDYPVDRILVDMSPYDVARHFNHIEHPSFPRETWREEVQSGDTLLGYWVWVSYQMKE